MLLHEIIAINEATDKSILIELLIPYKKALLTYYTDLFSCEPVLMVTSVSNACQYGKIVSSNDLSEAIEDYINSSDMSNEEKENEAELISFNSIMFKTL